jgi:hypothetical protein
MGGVTLSSTAQSGELAALPSPEGRFLDLMSSTDESGSSTSIRIPDRLREAAALATGLGYGTSLSGLAVQGLQDAMEAIAWRLALDGHYQEHPEVRPTLAMVAHAAAELDRSPLVDRPDLIERAAAWCEANRAHADADEVLLVAEGMLLAQR